MTDGASNFVLPLAAIRLTSRVCRINWTGSALTTFYAAVRKALSDRRAEADAVSYLGQALEHRSPVEARVMHERALSLYQAAQDRRGESDALCNLGKLLVRMGEVEAGIHFDNKH